MAWRSRAWTKSHSGTPSALVTAKPSFGSSVSPPVMVNRQLSSRARPSHSSAAAGPVASAAVTAMASTASVTRRPCRQSGAEGETQPVQITVLDLAQPIGDASAELVAGET